MSQVLRARGLLLDLDDTLYDYAPAERAARVATLATISRETGLSVAVLQDAWGKARLAVKARVGDRAASHSRLLYLAELAHVAPAARWLGHLRRWERLFWRTYLESARLREGARELLERFRALGGRVAIVSNLTLEVQLWKLEELGLIELIDALVTSEEVASEKPSPEAFLLAMERLHLNRDECVMVGDNQPADEEGARRLGLRFLLVRSSEGGAGLSLTEVAEELFR